jgi:hypothetical protein
MHGYSRDQRRGSLQIVYGLMCDRVGRPIAVEVFASNTVLGPNDDIPPHLNIIDRNLKSGLIGLPALDGEPAISGVLRSLVARRPEWEMSA